MYIQSEFDILLRASLVLWVCDRHVLCVVINAITVDYHLSNKVVYVSIQDILPNSAKTSYRM